MGASLRLDPLKPLSLLNAVKCSLVPLVMLICAQPMLLFGILGLPTSWWDVLTLDMDLDGLLAKGQYINAIGTVLAFIRPTIPGDSPTWLRQLFPLLAWLIFSDDATVQVGRSYNVENALDDSKPPLTPETFVYVNGICTTKLMALATGAELGQMFKRDVTVVHNPTDSAILDILECVFSKLWIGQNWVTSKPTSLVVEQLMTALQDEQKTKVVLIAHSQGTIIAADVLWRLWAAVDAGHLPQGAMGKLEMYNIANAAHWMMQRDGAPYIENIGNHYDNVGMLGANAPPAVKKEWNIDIAGEVILPNKPRWGHMISSHYLKHLKNGDYTKSKLHYCMTREAHTAPESSPTRAIQS